MRYKKLVLNSNPNANASASTPIMIPSFDIRGFQNFSVTYQNSGTSTAFLDLQVQVANNPTTSQSDTSDHWVQLPTATLPQPSALAALAIVTTAPINNGWGWARVLGKVTVSSSQSLLTVTLAGFGDN